MKIGIIGAGKIGQAFARQATGAGYEVAISNSRGVESLAVVVKNIGGNIKAVTVKEAAEADIIFLGLQWQHLENAISGIKSWNNKIVIDPTNPILPGFVLADLKDKTSSELVEDWVPGAKLVKAFNTHTPELLASNSKEAGGSRVIFYSGNHDKANAIVAAVIDRMGFAGIYLGKLNEGGKLQQFPGGPLPTLHLIKLPL